MASFFEDLKLLNCWDLGTESVHNPFTLLSGLCTGRSDTSRKVDVDTRNPQSLLTVPLLLYVEVKLRILMIFHPVSIFKEALSDNPSLIGLFMSLDQHVLHPQTGNNSAATAAAYMTQVLLVGDYLIAS